MSRSLIPVLTPHGSLRLDQAEDEFSLEDGLAERARKALCGASNSHQVEEHANEGCPHAREVG